MPHSLFLRKITYCIECLSDVVAILFLCFRYKRPPQILLNVSPGFIVKSEFLGKKEIFDVFKKVPHYNKYFVPTVLLPRFDSLKKREKIGKAIVRRFGFPILAKPNYGMCGRGIGIIETPEGMKKFLASQTIDHVLQPYIAYEHDMGVFCTRVKGKCSILGIGERLFPVIIGDGRKTIETLAKKYSYQKPIIQAYLLSKSLSLRSILPKGQPLILVSAVEANTTYHYIDRSELITPAVIDRFSMLTKGVRGFDMGRFDIRVRDIDAFALNGSNFAILELNAGPDAMLIHLRDSKHSFIARRRGEFAKWDTAFQVACARKSIPRESFWGFIKICYHYLGKIASIE